MFALFSNTTGGLNTASGNGALAFNTTGHSNTASGYVALYANTTGSYNTALGDSAGIDATTGNWNLLLGASVTGTLADANTIRIGRPYDGTNGQNQTFIAGIRGAAVTGGLAVVIDANGQLGTASAVSIGSGGVAVMDTVAALTTAAQKQQATIADLRTTIADLDARLARLEALVGQSAGIATKP